MKRERTPSISPFLLGPIVVVVVVVAVFAKCESAAQRIEKD